MVVAVKLLYSFNNFKPNDPNMFKEKLKVKFNTVLAIVENFSNGTGVMENLLKAETPTLNWGHYCTMLPPANQLIWEEKADALNKAILILMNSKNDNANKDLDLSYSQGNKTAYPVDVESMVKYIKNINNPQNKKGDKNGKKGDEHKSKNKDNNITGTAGAQVGETTTPQDSSPHSNGSSIGTHVSEVSKSNVWPTRSVQDILKPHAIIDSI